jgi:hypothetical protein
VFVLFVAALPFTCYTTRVKPIHPRPCASTALFSAWSAFKRVTSYTKPLEQLYPSDITTTSRQSLQSRTIHRHVSTALRAPSAPYFLLSSFTARTRPNRAGPNKRTQLREQRWHTAERRVEEWSSSATFHMVSRRNIFSSKRLCDSS